MVTRQEVRRLGDLRRAQPPGERYVRHPAVRDTVSGDVRNVPKSAVHHPVELKKCLTDDAEARQDQPAAGAEDDEAGSVDR